MSKFSKLIGKVLNNQHISYAEAEILLQQLGFDLEISGSHHIFRKKGYYRNVSLKRSHQLLSYQLKDIKEVLRDHGY